VLVPLTLIGAEWLACNIRLEWFWIGLAVSGLGELLQLWCFATFHKQQTLATNWLYKVVRNPMYLARFLLLFSCLMFLWNGVVLLLLRPFITFTWSTASAGKRTG
jgi:protein-S-isoprenylcysteine O-methyltransferase Ste14